MICGLLSYVGSTERLSRCSHYCFEAECQKSILYHFSYKLWKTTCHLSSLLCCYVRIKTDSQQEFLVSIKNKNNMTLFLISISDHESFKGSLFVFAYVLFVRPALYWDNSWFNVFTNNVRLFLYFLLFQIC